MTAYKYATVRGTQWLAGRNRNCLGSKRRERKEAASYTGIISHGVCVMLIYYVNMQLMLFTPAATWMRSMETVEIK